MKDILLIGIDGGATKVSGWQVISDEDNRTFKLGSFGSSKSYKEIPGFLAYFKPIAIPEQLSQRDAGNIRLTSAEEQQEVVYVEACARVIACSSTGPRIFKPWRSSVWSRTRLSRQMPARLPPSSDRERSTPSSRSRT